MSVRSVKSVMEQRLVRGTKVVVASSHDDGKLRGKTLVVVSKNTVRCKGGDRCAGKWCAGLAVFAATYRIYKKNRGLGWREGAHKICLTHLQDEDGNLLLPPSAMEVAMNAASSPSDEPTVVTWDDLANAAADNDFMTLVMLARALKKENEILLRKVIAAQEEQLNRLLE